MADVTWLARNALTPQTAHAFSSDATWSLCNRAQEIGKGPAARGDKRCVVCAKRAAAMKKGSTTVELSDVERRVLLVLTPSTPHSPNWVGAQLWSREGDALRYGNCSAPYARPAGKILNKLARQKLVERTGRFGWWVITRAGVAARTEKTA